MSVGIINLSQFAKDKHYILRKYPNLPAPNKVKIVSAAGISWPENSGMLNDHTVNGEDDI